MRVDPSRIDDEAASITGLFFGKQVALGLESTRPGVKNYSMFLTLQVQTTAFCFSTKSKSKQLRIPLGYSEKQLRIPLSYSEKQLKIPLGYSDKQLTVTNEHSRTTVRWMRWWICISTLSRREGWHLRPCAMTRDFSWHRKDFRIQNPLFLDPGFKNGGSTGFWWVVALQRLITKTLENSAQRYHSYNNCRTPLRKIRLETFRKHIWHQQFSGTSRYLFI